MARKPNELRPLMTRIPESLRRQLERAAKKNGRSMNTELIHRLQVSFEVEQDHWANLMQHVRVGKLIDAEKAAQKAEGGNTANWGYSFFVRPKFAGSE